MVSLNAPPTSGSCGPCPWTVSWSELSCCLLSRPMLLAVILSFALLFNWFDQPVPCPAGDLRSQVESTPPSPRQYFGFALAINKLFVFGGHANNYGESACGVEWKACGSGLVLGRGRVRVAGRFPGKLMCDTLLIPVCFFELLLLSF